MKKFNLITLTLLAAAMPLFGGVPKVDLISADAKWGMHIDLDAIGESPIGQYILDNIKDEKHAQKLDAVAGTLGFDPRKDLSGLTVYGDGTEKNAVALISGNFDPQKLINLAVLEDTYEKTVKGSYTIHSTDQGKHDSKSMSFVGSNLIVFGQTPAIVGKALDVIDGKRPSAAANQEVMDIMKTVDTPFIISHVNLAAIADLNPKAKMLKQGRTSTTVIGQTAERLRGTMVVTMQDEQTATNGMAMMNGLLAMAQMQQDNKELQKALDIFNEIVEVEQHGSAVVFSLDCDMNDVVEHMHKMAEKHHVKRPSKK